MYQLKLSNTSKYLIVFCFFLFLTEIGFSQCVQNYNWTTWTNFSSNTASGTVINNGIPITVTMSANYNFGSTPTIYNYSLFSGFGGLPNATVPQTTWSIGSGGVTTMCFSQTVDNPVLLISSLGDVNTPVKLTFSKKYVTVLDKGGMVFPSDTAIIGAEGNAIIVFPGKFDCVTIYSSTPEYYTNITWGLEPPIFPVTITGNTINCDSVKLSASGAVSYIWSGGNSPNTATNTFTNSGTYFLTATDANGCKVTTSKEVKVNTKSSKTIDKTICQGDSYLGYSVAGTYVDTFKNATGCDSIRTLNLVVNQKKGSTINKSICEGTSFLGYSSSGTYIDIFTGTNGCDSIRTINLVVLTKSRTSVDKIICQGDSFLGYTSSGSYIDTFVAANGCDSIRILNLTVTPQTVSLVNKTICTGESYLGYSVTGTFIDTFKNINGCDSVRTLKLTVENKLTPYLGSDTELCTGDILQLSPGQFPSYLWQDGSTKDQFLVKAPGLYSVSVTNSCGSFSDEILITPKNCTIFFPNAFTPNKDGRNDEFKILNAYNLQNFHLTVYTRYGEKVFETFDFTKGWDGTINNKPAVIGSYVWYCTFDGQPKPLKGTVYLIR